MTRSLFRYARFLLPLCLWVIFTAAPVDVFARGLLRVHFISAGYGDAVLIESPDGETLMVDAGEALSGKRIVRYLLSQRIDRLDHVIITHPHKNHFEGFLTVLDAMPAGRIFFNGDDNNQEGFDRIKEKARDKGLVLRPVKRGERLSTSSGALVLDVLHPQEIGGTNESSLVTLLRYKDVSVLLTADIGPAEQEEILALYPNVQNAHAVQVPHHGGSVSPLFVTAFAGRIKIISTGENTWGSPLPETLEALEGEFFRTDRDGDIVLESDGKDVWVAGEK